MWGNLENVSDIHNKCIWKEADGNPNPIFFNFETIHSINLEKDGDALTSELGVSPITRSGCGHGGVGIGIPCEHSDSAYRLHKKKKKQSE